MSVKVKGLLKGLRYISQIFEEEKEQEIQIGHPTDVKHVAHIGWDGPAVDSPSWMREFNSPGHSAPLSPLDAPPDNSEMKWISEDSKRGSRPQNSPSRDSTELKKPSPRQAGTDNSNDLSPKKKDGSIRSRNSRKHRPKDSSEGSVRSRQPPEESNLGTEPETRKLPDIPKKSRRKKSKETINGGSTRSRYKATNSNMASTSNDAYIPPFSDPGQGPSVMRSPGHHPGQTPHLKPIM